MTEETAQGTVRKGSGVRVLRKGAIQCLLFLLCCATAHGGSRLVEPPTRSSLWRYGFGTPVNFHDDEVNCGGFQTQHINNEGMCGVCGDPWSAPTPRDNEAGGALTPEPLPVRVYKKGTYIPVAVESTSELLGRYEFRLCKLESPSETPDQTCFDQFRLSIVESEYGQSYQISQAGGLASLHLKLPDDMVCSHCLLQWRHITGHKISRQGCVQCGGQEPQCNYCKGCGDQEWYQGCADIAIIDVTGTHPAVLGMRSQQELKEKWDAFLRNCSAGRGDAPNGHKTQVNTIDSKINVSHLLPESSSSDFASFVRSNVTGASTAQQPCTLPTAATTRKVQTTTTTPASALLTPRKPDTSSRSAGEIASRFSTQAQTASKDPEFVLPTTRSEVQLRTGVGPTAPPSTVPPSTPKLGTFVHQVLLEIGVLTPASGDSKPIMVHGVWNSFHNGGMGTSISSNQQQSNMEGQRRKPPAKVRPSTPQCYVPYKPPRQIQSAAEWCKRHCPRKGELCHYKICRPIACPWHSPPPRKEPSARIPWFFSFFLDGLVDIS